MARTYVIAYTASNGTVFNQSTRHRSNAAWLAFNRMVDQMVREHAGLDTLAGTTAQKQARAATMPRLKGSSAETSDVTIRYRDSMVTVRVVAA